MAALTTKSREHRLVHLAGAIDLRRTWQVAVGAILLGAGAAALLIGYHGVARTPYVAEQLPYLVSGGIAGLAMVTIGGFFFWAHWLYRMYERSELHQAELVEELRGLRAALGGHSFVEAVPVAAAASATTVAALVMTARGSVVHDPGCKVVATNAASRSVTREEAVSSGLPECSLCRPLTVSSAHASPTPVRGGC